MNEEENLIIADKPALQIESVSGCYSFTIRNTKQSSAVFGNCEICNKPASEIWHQKRLIGNCVISDGYGHKECLENNRTSKSAEEARKKKTGAIQY